MATFGEIAYAIQDFSKTISDDSLINIDHIIFLMSKSRNELISKYNAIHNDINHQVICVNLKKVYDDTICNSRPVLVSDIKIPNVMNKNNVTLMPPSGIFFSYNMQFVDKRKFSFVGNNIFLKNIIYATILDNNKLYLTSNNTDFMYLSKIRVEAIYDDIIEASKYVCDDNCNINSCDIYDRVFPLSSDFLPTLMQKVVRDITNAAWQPRDDKNNAADDLAALSQILSRYTNNQFKNKMKGNENE